MASFTCRCVFRWQPGPEQQRKNLYEERMTLWDAASVDLATELAEREAAEYARENDAEFLGFLQAYALPSAVAASGVEVFSLLRESDLEPTEYLNAHFDTGLEHERDA